MNYLVHAYNCTRNDSKGFSPYYLMFGREARLPVDLCFGVSPDGVSSEEYLQYITQLREQLKEAYRIASDAARRNNTAKKNNYDRRVCHQELQPGDRVLLRNLGIPGKHKIADGWKPQPYVIEKKLLGLPTYQVKPESGNGPIKTFHRNHLLLIGQLVEEPICAPQKGT